jgi:hypothetical protein
MILTFGFKKEPPYLTQKFTMLVTVPMDVFTLILPLKVMLVEHVRLYKEGADFYIFRATAPCARRQAGLLSKVCGLCKALSREDVQRLAQE